MKLFLLIYRRGSGLISGSGLGRPIEQAFTAVLFPRNLSLSLSLILFLYSLTHNSLTRLYLSVFIFAFMTLSLGRTVFSPSSAKTQNNTKLYGALSFILTLEE